MAANRDYARGATFLAWQLLLLLGFRHRCSVRAGRDGTPPVLLVTGKVGLKDNFINGEYVLRSHTLHGYPTWSRRVLQHKHHEAHIAMSACGSWMISGEQEVGREKCSGWARCNETVPEAAKANATANATTAGPWRCAGDWEVWAGDGWKLSETSNKHGFRLSVQPMWSPPTRASSGGGGCSRREQRQLARRFAKIDIVVPWVNGSDPAWLAAREAACDEWTWKWMWPDAVMKSAVVQKCLADRHATSEARKFKANGGCEGADGAEQAVCTANASAPARGLTTNGSFCFKRFDACAARVASIGDHDELRYLFRSMEHNLPWHRGRVFLVLPRGQRPNWLREAPGAKGPLGRLVVLEQEALLTHAMSAPEYVPWSVRGGVGGYAPDRIFNDYPVEHAIAFIPNVSRQVLLIQDDIMLARKTQACDFFTRPPHLGLRLYGRPWEGEADPDPHSNIYRQMQETSAVLWAGGLRTAADAAASSGSCAAASGSCAAAEETSGDAAAAAQPLRHPYYMPYHLPVLLDVATLRRLWRRFPARLSASIDTPFRSANVTDIVGLHHAELSLRSERSLLRAAAGRGRKRRRRPGAAVARRPSEASRIIDLDYHMRDHEQMAMNLRIIKEVRFTAGTGVEWSRTAQALVAAKGDPKRLPLIVSFQDALDRNETLELDCHRESWLVQLFPKPSAVEGELPSRCPRQRARRMRAGLVGVVCLAAIVAVLTVVAVCVREP